MYSTRTTLLFLLISLTTLTAKAQTGPPLGMVLEANGTVEIERDGTRNGLRLADLLYAGDRVITGSGQVAFVFCPNESRIGLAEDASLELTESGITSLDGPEPTSNPVPCVLPQVSLGAESMERVGALRGRGYPAIELYLGGQISQIRPSFHWGALEEVDSYHVSLTTEGGDFVWETDTSDSAAVYPESMSALEDGQIYRWEVTARSGNDIVGQQAANLTVMGDTSFEEAEIADDLVRAVALENAGFYSESAAVYRQFRESEGDRIGRRLAWLYWNSGLIAAANAELDRLQ